MALSVYTRDASILAQSITDQGTLSLFGSWYSAAEPSKQGEPDQDSMDLHRMRHANRLVRLGVHARYVAGSLGRQSKKHLTR
jgi:hypothetical protein